MSGISIGISQYIAFPWEDYFRKQIAYKRYLSQKEALKEAKNLLMFQVKSLYHRILFLYNKQLIHKENKTVLQQILKVSETMVANNRMASS